MKTERKKRDKKHLKVRILRSISLILICSMILSTLIGYLYFNQVVRKQRLEEEKNRLMQVGSQIAFQAEDNRRFAQSILVDEQLQYLLEENVKGNEFRRQNQYDKVTKRLVFYNNLRTFLEAHIRFPQTYPPVPLGWPCPSLGQSPPSQESRYHLGQRQTPGHLFQTGRWCSFVPSGKRRTVL